MFFTEKIVFNVAALAIFVEIIKFCPNVLISVDLRTPSCIILIQILAFLYREMADYSLPRFGHSRPTLLYVLLKHIKLLPNRSESEITVNWIDRNHRCELKLQVRALTDILFSIVFLSFARSPDSPRITVLWS